MATTTYTPKLDTPHDWTTWFNMIKAVAMDNQVWQYCDPDQFEEIDEPDEPTYQLTATQERVYSSKLKDSRHKQSCLAKVNATIQSTVSLDYQTYFEDAVTPRDRLKALRSTLKPSMKQIRSSVKAEYESLIRGPKRTSVDKWLSRWISIAPRLRSLKISNLSEADACRGFIEACETVNPLFYNNSLNYLGVIDENDDRFKDIRTALQAMKDQMLEDNQRSSDSTVAATSTWQTAVDNCIDNLRRKDDPDKLTIAYLVGRFRQFQPNGQVTKSTSKASFATFQGRKRQRDSDEDEDSDTPKDHLQQSPSARTKSALKRMKRSKDIQSTPQPSTAPQPITPSTNTPAHRSNEACVCGSEHTWLKCYYLNPQASPPSWKPNDATQTQVIKRVQGDRRLKGRIASRLYSANVTPPTWFTQASKEAGTAHAIGRAAFTTQKLQAMATTVNSDRRFYLDSCSNSHICADIDRFTVLNQCESETLKAGDFYTTVQGTGIVTVTVTGTQGPFEIDLHDVAYCPGFHMNLISYPKLRAKGLRWSDYDGWLMLNGQRYIEVTHPNGWPLIERSSEAVAMATSSAPLVAKESIERWHTRLGHPRLEVLRHLPSHVQGVLYDETPTRNSQLCPECIEGQQQQQIHRTKVYPGSYPFEKVHFDLIEAERGFNLDRWVLHFYCSYSGYHVAFTLRTKSGPEVTTATESFIKLIQTWGFTIRELQSDDEKALNEQWRELIRLNGITHRKSPPYTPSQNGPAERSGGVIIATARKIYLESKLPISLWPYFIDQAVRILNRLPVQRKRWITPYELVHGRQPNLAGFMTVGSKAYVLNKTKLQSHKLRSKSIIGYLLGTQSANIFIIWIPELMRAIYARDVVIDEQSRWSPNSDQGHASLATTQVTELIDIINDVDLSDEEIDLAVTSEHSVPKQQLLLTPPISEPDIGDQAQASSSPPPESPPPTSPLLPASSPQLQDHPPTSPVPLSHPHRRTRHPTTADALQNLRSRSGRTITLTAKAARSANVLKRTQDEQSSRRDRHAYAIKHLKLDTGLRQAFAAASSLSTRPHISQLKQEPGNWREMLKHPEVLGFKAAAQAEMDAHKLNDTWLEVDAPTDQQILPLRWVFKYKADPEGYLLKHKARLCVRGDLQWPTYEDIYAATGAYRTLRILLAIVAVFDLICEKGDIKNAFTKASLNRPVYTQLPQGYAVSGKAYLLKKALYGLKISPKLWYTELADKLKLQGLQSCPDDPCLFIHPVSQILVFIYVDDLLFIAHPSQRLNLNILQQDLDRAYGIQGLGPADSFLNIRFVRDRQNRTLSILQNTYIESIARKYGQLHAARPNTPLSSSFKAIAHSSQATQDQVMAYQQRIGSILYAAIITRPDVAFAVSLLAQFTQNPSPEHLAEANRVIAYLLHTRHLAIQYKSSGSDEAFKASSDASFADDAQSRRSSQGYLLSLFNGPVAWQASKQRIVVTSTTEAELLSLSHAAREVLNIARLFNQIGLDIEQQLTLLCDNQQTVRLITHERPELNTRLKHIDIHHHWVRQEHHSGSLNIEWIPTSEMPADGLTKLLTKAKHISFISSLGMSNLADHFSQSDPIYSSSEDDEHSLA